MRRGQIYRASVLILLALILGQVAGLIDLRSLPYELRRLGRDLANIGQPKEEAAPWTPADAASGAHRGGLLDLYADDIEKAYQREAQQAQQKK